MLIRAAIVPPEEAVEELWVATRALRMMPGIVAVPADRLDIPVTSFGNLVPPDSARLAASSGRRSRAPTRRSCGSAG